MFISYRFSTVPIEELTKLIDPIFNYLKSAGIDVFCNFYYDSYYVENKWTAKQIMEHCFENMESKDNVLCLIDTDAYSCGMLLEMGYALKSKKNIIVCCREGCEIETLLQMANTTILYSNYEELLEKLTRYLLENPIK